MYTKCQLGQELKNHLTDPYDPLRVAKWAEGVHHSRCTELSQELYEIIEILSVMSFGPEFAYSKEELALLADELINNEKDPLRHIQKKSHH